MDRRETKAMARLDAALEADDVTPEEYARERARIRAGTSSYLRRSGGLISRAAEGEREAIVKLGIIGAVGLTMFIGGCAVIAPGQWGEVERDAPPSQYAPDGDDDDYEGEED